MKHHSHIDGLRAVAVLPVILFHFNLLGVTGGYAGVDVFFVISGFLITGILFDAMQKNRFSILRFYERRARRILPALFVMSLLCLAGALLLFVPDDFVQFSKSLEGVAGFASNFIFARWVGYFEPSAMSKPLLHTWSLAVEEQFYIFFPLLLYALNRFFSERRRTFTLCLYGVLILSFGLNLAFVESSPDRTFYLLHTRAWELMLGAILVLHLQKIKLPKQVHEAMGVAGMAGLIVCYFFYDRNTVFPGAAALLPCLAAAALIWADLQGPTRVGRLLSSKPMVAVGLISYGLYLYHWPVLVFTRYYLDRDPAPAVMAGCLAAIAALSFLSYRYIETPVRNGKMLAARKDIFTIAVAVLIMFGCVGQAGIQAKGFPRRFEGAALQYASGAQDRSIAWDTCPRNDPKDITTLTVCKLGVAGRPPDFLVWGDSHLDALLPAIDALAKRHGQSAWAVFYAGCAPLLNVPRTDGFVDISCTDSSAATFRLIRQAGIRNVLLVARWNMYALGWEEGSVETVRAPSISFRADGKTLTGKEAFAAAFAHTVRELDKAGANIWVMDQVPPQLMNVPAALAKAAYLGRDASLLQRPYAEIAARLSFVDGVFAATAKEYPLHRIDPAMKFCPEKNSCLISDRGHALYWDNSHLSVYGALWSQDMLAPFFASLQKSSGRG